MQRVNCRREIAAMQEGEYRLSMYIGLGVFAVLAIVCVFAGVTAMKRRRDDYGEGDGEMGEAEFRKYEGFDN